MKPKYQKPHVVRPIATAAEIEAAFIILHENLQRRIDKFGYGKHISPAENMGILLEEWKELIDAHQGNDLDEFAAELMDVAVTCVWGIISFVNTEP